MTDTVPTRSVDVTTEIAAPADAVWAALTQADLLCRWFSPTAERDGDKVRLAWGPDMVMEERFVEVEKGRHLRWADTPDAPIIVDWHLETKGGHTVVRLVQSGLSASAEWDDAFDSFETGWRYFLFNLRHYLTRHRGTPRDMAWIRRPTELARSVLWERLMTAVKKVTPRADIAELKPSRGVWATIPDLNDAVLFLEIEGKTLGVYLSTYGLPADKVRELQPWVDNLSLVAT